MNGEVLKIKQGFILSEIAGNYLVVAVGERVKNFNKLIKLNETGSFLWKILEKGATQEQLVEKLLKEYDIDRTTAEQDVNLFVSNIKEAGLAE